MPQLFLQLELLFQLLAGLEAEQTQLTVAKADGRQQPVFTLCWREVLPSLSSFLSGAGSKIDSWFKQLNIVEVEFADENAVANINTRKDQERLE